MLGISYIYKVVADLHICQQYVIQIKIKIAAPKILVSSLLSLLVNPRQLEKYVKRKQNSQYD